MFLAQIHGIEEQIASLEEQLRTSQQQLQQYQNLREKAADALALLKEIQQQAANIGEAHHWQSAVMQALDIEPPTPPTSTNDSETDAEIEEEPEDRGEDEYLEQPKSFDDKYSTPEELTEALQNDDADTILMDIANILDSTPATAIEGKVWYFVQNLPLELCDRIIPYLPKSIVPEWRKQMEVAAEEAKASIFPQQAPTTYEYEPEKNDIVECKNNGLVGRVTYVCDSPNGRMASVLLPGGTSNFHISNLKFISKHQEEEPTASSQPPQEESPVSEDSEIDQLAKQCLGLRSWSQMRIFADSNPAVITRMQEIASTKAEKRVVNNMPALIIGYIGRAGDRSDLTWLPEPVLSEVETLLTQEQVQSIA